MATMERCLPVSRCVQGWDMDHSPDTHSSPYEVQRVGRLWTVPDSRSPPRIAIARSAGRTVTFWDVVAHIRLRFKTYTFNRTLSI